MSSPTNTSQAGREASANGSATSNVDDKPRLSEHEKKANHIASGECCPFLLAETMAGAMLSALATGQVALYFPRRNG